MRNLVAISLGCFSPGSLLRAAAAAVLSLAGVTAASVPQARAETKVFFVENQPDDYGIDECLASGATCGRSMASTFCRAREYDEAVSFRRAEPEEMLREAAGTVCTANSCSNLIVIECQR